ncbi:MAG TPA: hypothetical protein VM389_02795 [Phycisphaerae bacterium]|nr:hypothetical protein [Phycisphaerae bacterium]
MDDPAQMGGLMAKGKGKPQTFDGMVYWAVSGGANGLPASRDGVARKFGVTKALAMDVRRQALRRAKALLKGSKPPKVVAPKAKAPKEEAPSKPAVFKGGRKFNPQDPAYRGPTIQKLRRTEMSIPELAEFLGADERGARLMVDSLRSVGYIVEDFEGRYRLGALRPDTVPKVLKLDRLRTPERAFGLIADTHCASTKQRLDVAEMAYDEFKRQKITTVIHGGNLIDGYHEGINGGEVLFRNCDDQVTYLADIYPQRRGITTMFITGDCHEGWWVKAVGMNIGEYIEDQLRRHGRTDLKYVGHLERDFELAHGTGAAVMRVFHSGGGTSYAMSYQPQKIVETYQGGEKPAILLLGHFHKLGVFYPREVWTVLMGCCQDQTVFMRKRRIAAHVGFSVMRVRQDDGGGVSGVAVEMFPFYDRRYHVGQGDMWERSVAEMLATG